MSATLVFEEQALAKQTASNPIPLPAGVAVLVVAGRIDEAKTLELVNEYFGSIPKPARKLGKTYTKEPVQDGERQITMPRTGDVQRLVHVTLRRGLACGRNGAL